MATGNQRTLFPQKDSTEPLVIYCSGCGDRRFKIHARTLEDAGIVSVKCPDCGNGTSLSIAPTGNIIIVPGYPEENLPKKKRTRKVPEQSA